MSAENADSMRLPDGMTAEKLRKVADWLDTYDKLAERFILLTRSAVQQETAAAALVAIRGDGVQADLRRWAAAIAENDGSVQP